jgi:hypothetical protein
VFCLLFSFISENLFSQREHAFEMNARLGLGINFGNMFEAPSLGAWGVNPDSAYFRDVKSKGFASLRLPVSWSTHAMTESPYTIDKVFMDTIIWAVNSALQNGLPVIINIHNYAEIMTDPAGNKDRFLAFWEQIATQFQNYSDSLYFEILNEPNGNLTPDIWNDYLAEGLAKIRETNPTRMVIIGTANWGGIDGLSQLQLPADSNIILTIHYYNPFDFTHQGTDFTGQDMPAGISWDSTSVQTAAIVNDMNIIKQYSQKNNVPVYIGEFGANGSADDASRAKWAGCLHRVFDADGFSGAYWEYCSGFGVYDPVSDCYHSGLLHALTGYEGAFDCSAYDTVIVRNGTFDKNISPWFLNQFPDYGATAAVEVVNGEARMEITSPGTESWHIQFIYSPITLKKGNTYTFMFDAYASAPVTIGADVSKNHDDYGAYKYIDAALTAEKKTFVSAFVYNDSTDINARISFECGLANVQYLYFDNIHLYENASAFTGIEKSVSSECTVKIGENKFSVEGNTVKSITVYDSLGRKFYRKEYQNTNLAEIGENLLPSNISFIQVQTDTKQTVLKNIKK